MVPVDVKHPVARPRRESECRPPRAPAHLAKRCRPRQTCRAPLAVRACAWAAAAEAEAYDGAAGARCAFSMPCIKPSGCSKTVPSAPRPPSRWAVRGGQAAIVRQSHKVGGVGGRRVEDGVQCRQLAAGARRRTHLHLGLGRHARARPCGRGGMGVRGLEGLAWPQGSASNGGRVEADARQVVVSCRRDTLCLSKT